MIKAIKWAWNKIVIAGDTWWLLLIGLGIALSPINNAWLTKIATDSEGHTSFFLPSFGYLLQFMGSGMFLFDNWKRVKATGWGPRRLVIPLLIIAAAISLSGLAEHGIQAKFAPMGAAAGLFALYMSSRVLGPKVFYPLGTGVLAGAVGTITYAAFHTTDPAPTGGYIFGTNYDIIAGYLIIGAAVVVKRPAQYILLGTGAVALALSGSSESFIPLAVVGIAALWRRDVGWRALRILAPAVVISVLILSTGYATDILYV
jgi:hypothetical protein